MFLIGLLFDAVTLSVNIADVITDVLVCAQFYYSGHGRWLTASLISIIISNVLTTLLFLKDSNGKLALLLHPRRRINNMRNCVDRLRLFFTVLPIAQLLPLLEWLADWWARRDENNLQTSDSIAPKSGEILGDWLRDVKVTTGVGSNAATTLKSSFRLMSWFEDKIANHFQVHKFACAESIFESIPQALIQLSAISYLGSCTHLQSASILFSILSITTKSVAFVASQSISAACFKFFCCAADLSGFFYVFAAITSSASHQQNFHFPFFAAELNFLAFCMVWKWALLGLMIIISTFLLLRRRMRSSHRLVVPLSLLGACLVFVAELMKFSSLIILINSEEVHSGLKPAAALLYNYVGDAFNDKKSAERARKLVKRALRVAPNVAYAVASRQVLNLCETTSEEEPSDWECASQRQLSNFASRNARRNQVYSPETLVEASAKFSNKHRGSGVDLLQSPKHIIPAGTEYDDYIKQYINGDLERGERMHCRKLARNGGTFADILLNGNTIDKGVQGAALERSNPRREVRCTRYDHRVPFQINSICGTSSGWSFKTILQDEWSSSITNGRWNRIETIWYGLTITLIVIGQLFSTITPFVSFVLYYESQSSVQTALLISYVISVCVVLGLAREMVQYSHFMKYFVRPISALSVNLSNVSSLFSLIETMSIPTVVELLEQCTAPEVSRNGSTGKRHVLAPELSSVVAKFMRFSDFDLRAVGAE